MKFHAVAGIFPMAEGDELDKLAEDIRANGLLEPIWIHPNDGSIIDGRNRYRACLKAKIEPKTRKWNGTGSLVGFVISMNLHRRHLTAGQKAAVGVEMLPLLEAEAKARQATSTGGSKPQLRPRLDEAAIGRSDAQAAKAVGVSRGYIAVTKKIKEEQPSLYEEVRSGKKTIPQANKESAKVQRADAHEAAQMKISVSARKGISSVCDIRNCSMRDLLTSGIRPDCIITDPPYPHEYLPLYGELAELSKNIPLVAVMCGQSYLPEVLQSMCAHLKYRWTLAYLTPGGQSVQLWQRKVNTFWKPVLLFGEIPDRWLGDVSKSEVNDNDKRFHDWGQSESGMSDLVERLSEPGQLICDPFVGGGSTAVAALRLGRRFVGSDLDCVSVEKSILRCEAIYA